MALINQCSSKPLVSIVMPVHNDEKFLKQAIDSVLEQSFQDFELLIVNDGSTDSSEIIISSYKDNRIIFINNNISHGAAAARNIALKKANGKYIAFLDADDIWKENKLEEQVQFMIATNCSFSYTKYDVINEDGAYMYSMSGPERINEKLMNKCCYIGCLTAMYDASKVGILQVPTVLKKRNDYALWLQAIEKTHQCLLLDKVLAFYRKQSNGISSNKARLFIWHYRLFRYVKHASPIISMFYALRNIVFYFGKRKYRYSHE